MKRKDEDENGAPSSSDPKKTLKEERARGKELQKPSPNINANTITLIYRMQTTFFQIKSAKTVVYAVTLS